ncbi:hypothetical protein N7510_002365 [Penicillium lagena]|uniref:uncharacterized protein n=1 Tax=Penicillium lagena TaxID=94218 RepID=UPI0025407130|nr:uncharacterized protein N7510_002365 [Penicillium lagena]KAJ5626056.1 hypothetical protein N7510_002365 [Penicillium lagena]
MSDDRSTSPISVPNAQSRQRRGSLGATFTDLFAKQNNAPPASGSQATGSNGQTNQQRRLSISTLGLSGSPTQTSAFGSRAFRQGSLSSSMGSNAPNAEDAVGEDAEGASPGATPNSPFARRVSFGAQALREARAGSMPNGRYPLAPGPPAKAVRASGSSPGSASVRSPPRSPAAGAAAASTNTVSPQDERSNASRRPTGEGFNWTEALRSRAERAPSIGGPISPSGPQSAIRQPGQHQRAASVATMEQPVREMPKQPKQNKPDFFQEKILRGDFMD